MGSIQLFTDSLELNQNLSMDTISKAFTLKEGRLCSVQYLFPTTLCHSSSVLVCIIHIALVYWLLLFFCVLMIFIICGLGMSIVKRREKDVLLETDLCMIKIKKSAPTIPNLMRSFGS